MRVMLNAHRNICCGPELKLLPTVCKLRDQMRGPLQPVMEAYHNPPQDINEHFRQLILGFFENYRRTTGKPRFAEKTPHNVLHMVTLGEIFPESRFLHVIRDGRDVASSLVTMNWVDGSGQKLGSVQNVEGAARYWKNIVQVGRRQANHPSLLGRVFEVRYESLVAAPEETLRQVTEFLGEPWDDAMLAHQKDVEAPLDDDSGDTYEGVRKPLYASSVGRWQNDMSDANKESFIREAGDLLLELGYLP